MSAVGQGKRPPPPSSGMHRRVFLTLLALWVIAPLLQVNDVAQDAVPFITAGDVVRSDPEAIYSVKGTDLYDLTPAFATRACEVSPEGTDCASVSVAFVSPPLALPFAFALSMLGPTFGVLLARALAGLALALGMWLLWGMLSERTPRAPQLLMYTAFLLTPFVLVVAPLGQNSPYMFLAACLGVRATDGRRWLAVAAAGLFALTISLKLFPVVLIAVLLWQRRFRLVALTAGWLAAFTLGALALGPPSLFRTFVEASSNLNQTSPENRFNGSWPGVLHTVAPGLQHNGAVTGGILAVELVGIVALAWWGLRKADDDVQWAWAFAAVLLFVPIVWWHYLWLGIAAIGVALAKRVDLAERWLRMLPIAAALTVPISLLHSFDRSAPVAQFAFLVASIVASAVVARRSSPRAERVGAGVPVTAPR